MGVQINGDTGNISATKADYSGNVTIGGTLTYEDVTNIDSVGLITARQGIEVGARPGVAASISVDGNAVFSGIVTAASFSGIDLGAVTGATGDFSIADKIVHTGDTNTAIRFPAADTITAETGGSERVRINSSGDVGIGINSPAAPLHVSKSYAAPTGGIDGNTCLLLSNSVGSTYAGLAIQGTTSGGSYIHFGDTDDINVGNILYDHPSNSMQFITNASERLRIDSSGNMGLGITPDTQGGTVDSLQIGSATNLYNETSDDYTVLGNNVYFDGTNNKYIKTQESSRLLQNAGEFTFQQAASGSADANITYTTPFKIDSSGRVLIGGTSHPSGASVRTLNLISTSTTEAALVLSRSNSLGGSTTGRDIKLATNGDLTFDVHNVGEKVRFPAAGGITFNGDTAAANSLDDYEEGSWTPNDASGGGVTINSTGTGGTYTKIGRLVHVQYNITYGSTSSSNSAAIGNLPFSQDVQYGTGAVGWTSRDNPAGIMGHIGAGHQIYFMDNTSASSNSGKHLQNQELSGVQIIGNATYYAAT